MYRSSSYVAALIALVIFGGIHCSSESSPSSSSPETTDAGPLPGGGSGVVTPSAGGTVQSSDGAVTIEVPPGAVAEDTTITIAPATSFPNDAQVVPGTVYQFGPEGIVFSAPVTMTIAYESQKLPLGIAASDLRIHKARSDGWDLVAGGSVDTTTRRARAEVLGFSTYGIRSIVAPDGGTTTPIPDGELFAQDPGYTDHIRVFGSFVYWSNTDASGGLIRRAPIAGGTAPETVASGLRRALNTDPIGNVDGLAEAGGKIFFTVENGLFSVPVSGGTPSPVASGRDSPTFGPFSSRVGLASDGTTVYWAGTGLQVSPPATAVLKSIASSAALCGEQMVQNEQCIYNTYCGDLAVMESWKTGENKLCTQQGADVTGTCCSEAPTFVSMHGPLNGAQDLSEARSVLVDGGFVYWAEVSDANFWIMRKPTAGGDPAQLATGAAGRDSIGDLTVGGGFAYWTQRGSQLGTYEVARVALTGGTPEVVATSTTAPIRIAADAQSLYYFVNEEGVYRRPHAAAAATHIAKGAQTYSDIAVSSAHVYFANSYVSGVGRVQEIRRIAK